MFEFQTVRTALSGGVLDVRFDAPPLNLIGPELVKDLVDLVLALPASPEVRVVVFSSADPEYFLPHVDLTKVPQYVAEAGRAGGPDDASLGMLWRKFSQADVVTIAKIRGRVGGAGSEFVLACDMQFASRETATFGQPEVGMGAPPGAGALQHLTRKLGRNRALEVLLGSADFTADEAAAYGWINKAVPDAELDALVATNARRIASFPAAAVHETKRVVNGLTLPHVEDVRADARRFQEFVQTNVLQSRVALLFEKGLQDRGPVELALGAHMVDLPVE
ncbi:enoyl-CoA hydratase/isomerase family protein [Lentzea cavernae]|uniref:Enoyl-CoA hydratase n=1 Tax=Lentzea cavernae TaxID=2020703 RepID=A0ABQ3M9G9_9PSEU|nr:enoyl-CoA hydratase/isomerase family protein [Lentzea cavernae]GHH32272.1 enoyl-CoA hydratase [Lentzea cavernae]